jgi:hypothetical protein
LTATAVDLNGTLDVSGTSTLTGIVTTGSTIATNEASPEVVTGGIQANTSSYDNIQFSYKNSDVSHGFTTPAEADTYFNWTKCDSGTGGIRFQGFKENGIASVIIAGYNDGTPDDTKSTSAGAQIELRAYVRSGTDGAATSTANGNLACIYNANTARFIFDAEGDFHADSSSTTFDAYDDAQLVRALDLSKGKGVINSKFDKFVAYNHEHLADLQLVGREKDGTPNHFINVTGFQRLHNGAIWQQYEKHERLLEAVYDLAKEAVGEEKANAILEKHEVKRLQ